ncbi:hypothetical protein NQ318_017436 [Aromia moschata]|uniref:EB domain-containing protein n=1 Tax=Aromia moschata TaxID=1265417 RepID=A0AAV8Z402_9CUCU|nr:hypothetical protein NQ318_017436 [Aromia moschata]
MDYSILTLTFCLSITVCAQQLGKINDKCRTVQECGNFGYLCARNRTCQCLHPLYVPNKEGEECVGIIDQKCRYDSHCIEGAFCEGQKICKCKDYLYPNEDGLCSSHS